MIEKLTDGKHILCEPNKLVIKYLKEILIQNNSPIFFEIGVGIGATTLAVAKLLNNIGKIFIFSKEKDCVELKKDLLNIGYNNIIDEWCCEDKTYSGYHFEIADAILQKKLPSFDVCFIDGGHVFHLDAPTSCMMKELCNQNGYIIFDDYNWSLDMSPSLNPKIRPQTLVEYDKNQIQKRHIEMVCKLFMDTDNRFQKMTDSTERVVAYKKIKH